MESSLEIRQLRAFLALVEQGTVTSAAQALGLAQSTMSEALASLERAVGAAVFVRRRGSHELVLTDAGEALLPHARALLDLVATAHVAVAGATTGARARVAIASNESLSTYVLAPQLDVMRRRWPNTAFEVSVMTCAGARAGVEAGEYDLGLLLQPVDDSTSTLAAERTIVSDDVPLVLFVQPSHPLLREGRTAPVRRESIGDYPLIISDAAGDFHLLVRRFLEHDGLPRPLLHPAGSIDAVKRGVAHDARAVGLLPVYALAEEIRDGRVVPLTVRPSPPRMRLEAWVPRTRAQHPAVRELIDAVCTMHPVLRAATATGAARAV